MKKILLLSFVLFSFLIIITSGCGKQSNVICKIHDSVSKGDHVVSILSKNDYGYEYGKYLWRLPGGEPQIVNVVGEVLIIGSKYGSVALGPYEGINNTLQLVDEYGNLIAVESSSSADYHVYKAIMKDYKSRYLSKK